METVIGLTIITLGSLGQSSSYVPIKKVKKWSWESFWLIQGIFAWLVFPYIGALISLPNYISLFELFSTSSVTWKCIGFGTLWGVGGLFFGLSMRYLGVSLGQSLSLGTCSAFGTIIPALLKGNDLFSGQGLILLLSVGVSLAGIAIISYAGSLKDQKMSTEEKKKAVGDFALRKGVLIAFLSGVMSASFSLGLDVGAPVKEHAISLGAIELISLNPVILLVTTGGFIVNAGYCIFQNFKNKSYKDYFRVSISVWINNLFFCIVAGILWYSQFFCFGIGQDFLRRNEIMLAFSWCILMSLNVIFSNLWGIILKEWKGSGVKTISVLIIGIVVLILSIFFPQLF